MVGGSRKGWKNRALGGSRIKIERYRPPHDTVLKRYRVARQLVNVNVVVKGTRISQGDLVNLGTADMRLGIEEFTMHSGY